MTGVTEYTTRMACRKTRFSTAFSLSLSLSLSLALTLALLALFVTPTAALYGPSDKVVVLTAANFDREVLQSELPVMVEFFAPWCGHCQRLTPEYKNAATKLQGLAKAAAIDCDEAANRNICGQHGIKGFPTLKLFKTIYPKKNPGTFTKTTVDYNGPRSAKGIVDATVREIPSHVTVLTAKKHEEWLKSDDTLAKVLFFNKKFETPYLYKALSTTFRTRLLFGEIRSSEKDLIKEYDVKDMPAVVVVTKDGEKVNYSGLMKSEGLTKFLEEYALPLKKGNKKGDKSKSDNEDEKKSAPVPEPFDPEVYELKDQATLESKCLSTNKICILAFLALEEEFPESVKAFNESLTILKSAKQTNHDRQIKIRGGDIYTFHAINIMERGKKVAKDFAVSDMYPSVLALVPNKKKFVNYRGAFEAEGLVEWLEDILVGRVRAYEYSFDVLLDKPKKETKPVVVQEETSKDEL